jgi:hypothetical protein
MELSDLKPGQKVRVTYEGVVQNDSFCQDGELAIRNADRMGYHYHGRDQVKVELVEPEYVNGAVYLDANDAVWQFWSSFCGRPAWFTPADETPYDFDRPARPLVRLVREASDG